MSTTASSDTRKGSCVQRPSRGGRRLVLLLCAALLSTQCGLGGAINNATTQTVAVLDKAIDGLGAESSAWRQLVGTALDELPAQASSLVRNELSDMLNRGIATAGAETRCTLDFIGNRMRQQLIRIRAQLLAVDAPLPGPSLCDVLPRVVDMTLPPASRNRLELFGYDFDTAQLRALHITTTGSSDVTSKIARPTRYHMTLNLSENGVPLGPTSERLALLWNNEEISAIAVLQPSMQVCSTRTATTGVLPGVTYTPPHASGDREFYGHGPDIRIDLRLSARTEQIGTRKEGRLMARYSMHAAEVGGDSTIVSGSEEKLLWSSPDGEIIEAILGPTSDRLKFRDDSHELSSHKTLVGDLIVVGDTQGEDVGETNMTITFTPAQVLLRKTKDCVSPTALLLADDRQQLSEGSRRALLPQLETLSPQLRTDLRRPRP